MLGDIWLAILSWLKEQTCLHDYGPIEHEDVGRLTYTFKTCRKCGRMKFV